MGKGGREVPRDNVKGNTIPSQVLNDDDDDQRESFCYKLLLMTGTAWIRDILAILDSWTFELGLKLDRKQCSLFFSYTR